MTCRPSSAHRAGGPNRFFDASREVGFLYAMIRSAILEEIPNELAWLKGYDEAFAAVDAAYNLPKSDISALIRMIHSNSGTLSANRRKQFAHLPEEVLDAIEKIVQQAFGVSIGTEVRGKE